MPHRDVRIEGLRLQRCLGEGGMSSVYLAKREATGEQLVVKIFDHARTTEHSDVALSRFFQEYQLLSQLRHKSIVRTFEQGFTDEHAYITMEYFPDGSLRERMQGPLPALQALGYAGEIAAALEAVHAAGIVHRDLKPQNVMFRADETLVLIDFGMARTQQDAKLTRTGLVLGTPHYMSPEQAAGVPVDGRSDLYALGVMLYEMVAGIVPFIAASSVEVLHQHRHAPVPPLPKKHSALQPVIERLLAKLPEQRFQSARDARDALDTLAGG